MFLRRLFDVPCPLGKETFFCFTAWLRNHCMEVFHWIAHELKDEPLFSTGSIEDEQPQSGAIYNDFDRENPFSSDDDEDTLLNLSFSQPLFTEEDDQNSNEIHDEINDEEPIDIFFESDNFDDYSEYPDRLYRHRVFQLLEKESHTLKLHQDVIEVYEERYQNDWQGPDSVFDLWLLGQGRERSWFPLEIFEAEHPEYKELVNSMLEEYLEEQSRPKRRKRRLTEEESSEQ